jgi:hypothetical protein
VAAYRRPAITIRILISSLGDRGEFVAVTVAAVPAPVRDRFHSLIWAAGDVIIPARVIPADVAHTGFARPVAWLASRSGSAWSPCLPAAAKVAEQRPIIGTDGPIPGSRWIPGPHDIPVKCSLYGPH